jgi:hypothetical protein
MKEALDPPVGVHEDAVPVDDVRAGMLGLPYEVVSAPEDRTHLR